MQNIFIINPAAGDGTALETVENALTGRKNCEIYLTKGRGMPQNTFVCAAKLTPEKKHVISPSVAMERSTK